DTQTGGASAVYGADAVAGVVNFILRRDFEGLIARGQGGISERGDRGSYFGSITAGTNFGGGRGNIAFNGEYSFSDDLYYTDRDDYYGAYSGRSGYQLVENTIGEPASGNGIPDSVFVRGLRNINISEGGLLTSVCPTAAATGETAAQLAARRGRVCNGLRNQTGQELGYTYVFNDAGNFVRNNVVTDFRPFGSTNAVGGQGSTLRLTGQLQPQLVRKAANILAHYDFSDAFRPFVEAKYVRITAIQEGQPTFGNYTYSINNAFLTTENRAAIQSVLAPGATSFTAQRFNVDFGGRGEDHKRETYRIVAGVEGTFNEDWRYEAAFNYGRTETFYRTEGNVDVAKFTNARTAVRNGAGQIVCGINADASATNDDAACVPVNLFGIGTPSAAALNYFVVDSTRKQHAEQYQATAFVSGDLSQLFELPGGPIGFSIGGEWRRETAYSAFDEFTRNGNTFLNAIPIFDPPALRTWEGYGEVRIPLLKDLPFVRELTVDGALRVSDYNIGRTGTVLTWNAGAIWSPVEGLRFRGSYARSVRAPSQSELFAAASQTFLNNVIDPCSQSNINNNPNRRANCAAAGVPTTEIFNGQSIPFTNLPSSGIRGLNGSNENLDAERSNSYTFGGVFQPTFVPGLALTVDYYNITIKNVIFSLLPQTIIDQCYNAPGGINNQFCAAVFRRPDGTFQGQSDRQVGGTVVNYTLSPTDRSFISGPFNFARQKTAGIDADLRYTRNLGDVRVDLHGIIAYVIRRDNFTDINRPEYIDRQLSELGDPRWRGAINTTFDFGAFDFGYDFRYVGKQTFSLYENQNSVQGRPPENADQYERAFINDITYHDIKFGIDINKSFRFYGGVDNVLDRLPPLNIDSTGSGSAIFDNLGRFFYFGARVNF
ncbi:MAG: TonB-dependent receptor, partial [Lysobacteraceae bacterium]